MPPLLIVVLYGSVTTAVCFPSGLCMNSELFKVENRQQPGYHVNVSKRTTNYGSTIWDAIEFIREIAEFIEKMIEENNEFLMQLKDNFQVFTSLF